MPKCKTKDVGEMVDPVTLVFTLVGLLVGGLGVYYTREQVRIARQHRREQETRPSAIPLPEAQSSQVAVLPPSTPSGSPEFEDSRYREWLEGETGYIDIRGLGIVGGRGVSAIRFPILQLFTPLYVRRGLSNFDLDQGDYQRGQRTALTEMIDATRCLVVMGDPGSGKTTFLRYLARRRVGDHALPLPIYLRLGDVFEFALEHKIRLAPPLLVDFCVDLSGKEDLGITPSGLGLRADNGQCLWLLDSLDELPSAAAREAMVAVIEEASKRWNRCRFVITSRPLAMTGKAIPADFDVAVIDEMEDEEIGTFLKSWAELLFVGAQEQMQHKYFLDLQAAIRDRSAIRDLARNPVMLTCMAVVHFNDRHLPEGRADLLEAVIYWLIRAKRRETGNDVLTPKFIERTFRELALAMFEIDQGRRFRVGRGFAAGAVRKLFAENEDAALEFLNREELESGILVRRGVGDVSFWHPSFQEYLAAKEIAGKTDDPDTGWWSRIRGHLDETEWREVISLVPPCLLRMGSDRVDLFLERLGNSCANSELAIKSKRVGLGGCIIRDLRAIGYEPINVPSWASILSDALSIFEADAPAIPLRDRYEAAVAYGLGGDPRLRNWEDTWVVVPGGGFLLGAQASDSAAPNFDPDAAPWEGPVTETTILSFELHKYPVTVEEFAQFVLDRGYQDSADNLWPHAGWEWRRQNQIRAPADWDSQLLLSNCPVTGISWFEALAYCNWLTLRDPLRRVHRLPSEAEWEYACRRGVPLGQRFFWGNHLTEGDEAEANWAGSNLRKKTPVGMFPRSNTPDGISDMIGNVEEWCADSWNAGHIPAVEGKPYVRPDEPRHILRGGSTIRFLRLCRPTYRSRIHQDKRYHTVGFRPARTRPS